MTSRGRESLQHGGVMEKRVVLTKRARCALDTVQKVQYQPLVACRDPREPSFLGPEARDFATYYHPLLIRSAKLNSVAVLLVYARTSGMTRSDASLV